MERLIPVAPNGISVDNFLEWQEIVICMGQPNGTIESKQPSSSFVLFFSVPAQFKGVFDVIV